MQSKESISKWIKVVEEGNTMLDEMANSRKDVMRKTSDLANQIISHLLKLVIFDSPHIYNHWIHEIDGWLNKIKGLELKPNKALLKKQDLYYCLTNPSSPKLSCNTQSIASQMRAWTLKDYDDLKMRDIDPEAALALILTGIEQISTDISNKKFATVRNYLEKFNL